MQRLAKPLAALAAALLACAGPVSASLVDTSGPAARPLYEPANLDRALACDAARRELADDRSLLLQKLAEAGAPARLLGNAAGWTDLSLFVPLLDEYDLGMWSEWYENHRGELEGKLAASCPKGKP